MPENKLEEEYKLNSDYNKEYYIKNKKKKKKEQSRKSRKRAVHRNRKYIEIYKIANPCPCGETEPCCLSFHHDKGDKTNNISDMVNRGYSIARIQKEIDKCIVLCLNCHARLHNLEKNDLVLIEDQI